MTANSEKIYQSSVERDSELKELWKQFQSSFPTDRHCLIELSKYIASKPAFCCLGCKSTDFSELNNGRSLKCNGCALITWKTAGSFFNRIRKPRAWLAAIWLLERGAVLSSSAFHRLVGIAQSSAFHILKKLASVISTHMIHETETIHSSSFIPIFSRRSRLTPANQHPSTEEPNAPPIASLAKKRKSILDEDENPMPSNDMGNENIKDFLHTPNGSNNEGFSDKEKILLNLLSDEPEHVDILCVKSSMDECEIGITLTILELKGAVQRKFGDRYVRTPLQNRISSPSKSDEAEAASNADVVKDTIKWLSKNFHGISRRYLQHYLAAQWCFNDRERWRPGKLIDACIRNGPMHYSEIIDYESPAFVCMHVEQELDQSALHT